MKNASYENIIPSEAFQMDCGSILSRTLFPGITLSFLSLTAESGHCREWFCENADAEAGAAPVMRMDYCHFGCIGWEFDEESSVCLEPGDLFLHMAERSVHTAPTFPQHCYEGISILIDLRQFAECPPELLIGSGVSAELLRKKFCRQNHSTLLSEDEKISGLFQEFFDAELPECQRLAWLRVKLLELLLYLARLPLAEKIELAACRADHVALIRQIHEELVENLDQRVTIDALAKQYLINTSTLKSVFKMVYGNSIAAHIKEHRIGKSARLLRETDESIAQIAREVGYENQSKYTAAFREIYQMTPLAYRKKYRG